MNVERQRLAESIFKEMLTLAGEAREAALSSRCGGDAELLAEVRSLLAFAQESATAGPLDRSAPAMLGLPGTSEAQVFTPGYRVGGYEVVGMLGVGGMGVVYRAEQLRPRRSVALKVIRPGLATPSVLKRFEYEAELLGRLDHPGIARIIEAGTAPTEFGVLPFFAMELVDGKPLTRFFADAPRPLRPTHDKIRMIAQVADAVEHAHQRGVIHRDLKPGNILVEPAGTPKILDFGVARATGGKEAEQRLTMLRTGDRQLVGTLAYMSPEQVAGDARDVDTRSDVYSLGVVLFELLTGKLPHPVNERSLPDAVRMIRDDEPKRLAESDPALGGDLDTILGKALAKEPRLRYQSAAELAADLRRYLDNAPILARPPSAAYQLRKFAARHRALVGAAAAAVVCLAAGLAASLYLWLDAVQARESAEIERGKAIASKNEAIKAREAAEEEAQRQRVLVGFYHDRVLAQVYRTGPSTAITDALGNALDLGGTRLIKGDNLNQARMLYSAGQIFAPCNDLRRSFDCLSRSVSLLEAMPNPPGQELFDIRVFWANQVSRAADAHRAAEINTANYRIAEGLAEPVEAEHVVKFSDGVTNWMLGRYEKAAGLMLAYRNYIKAQPGRRPMALFIVTNRIAPMLAEMGKSDEAQAYWDELVDMQDRFTGPNNEMSQFLNFAAITYEQLGDWDRAARERRRHVLCVQRVHDSDRDVPLQSRTMLARALLKVGTAEALAEALAVGQDDIAAARALAPQSPGAAADAYAVRLAALAAAGRTAEFATLREEAETFADRVALLPYEIIEIRLELARAALRSGDPAEAVRLATAEHERRVRVKGRVAPATLEAFTLRAAALAAAGNGGEARAVGQREIEARAHESGTDDYNSLDLIEAVARAAVDRGDLVEAERQMMFAFDTAERVTGWWTRRSLGLRVRLAEIRASTGRVAAARALLGEGVEKCRSEFGEHTPPHPRTRILLDGLEHLAPPPAPPPTPSPAPQAASPGRTR